MIKGWLMTAAAVAIVAPGIIADADPIQRVEVESLSMSFAVPDWIEWSPEFQPCGPAPLYYFSFELERITNTSNAEDPVVEYRAGGGDGGCERGSGGYEGPVGPVAFDVDPLGNAVHVVVDLMEGGDCCNHFDFSLTRPGSFSEADCVAGVVCANVWSDQQSFGVKAGVAFERSDYVLTLNEYSFLLDQYPEPEILELDVTLTRSITVELTNPI